MLQKMELQNKVIVVSGGARGIGKSIVRLLAELGAKIHFLYHQSKSQAEQLVEEARQEGKQIQAHSVDIRDKDQCACAIQSIAEQNDDRIDVLINNSGVIRDNLLVALEKEDIQTVLDTNLNGVFYMTQAVVPYMMRQRAGKIVNISSVSAEKGGRGQANYAASKGAINSFTKAMAVELAPRNITVNAVAPGVIETDMSKTVRELGGEETLSKILLKRYGKPEEIAYAVAFLVSPYANYITGEIIHVDGGFKMA